MPIKTDLLKKDKPNRTIMAKKTASVVTHLSCHEAQSISVPQLGVELGPWQWKLSIQTTRSPGKTSPLYLLWICCRFLLCGYHETDIEHLVHIMVYIDTSLTSITYKNSFAPPFMFLMSQLTSFYIVPPLRNYCKYGFLKILCPVSFLLELSS